MTDASGDDLVIAGRFRLGRFLGSGASSSVFEADDLETGDLAALKLQHPHLSARADARASFLLEVDSSPRRPHPNLVSVRSSGVHDESGAPQAFIALDHAPGITLAEWVDLHGVLSLADAATVASAALAGLADLHAQGLVHRDISPNNIMVQATAGQAMDAHGVRVIDFGLAAPAGLPAAAGADAAGPVPGFVVGSANYISPEQARGLPVDERGDLYSLAAVLYFTLTGEAPFPRASSELTVRAHVNSPPPLPSALRSGVPRELDRLVARGMSKRPDQRFASAQSMIDALAALGGRAPSSVATSTASMASLTASTAASVADDAEFPRTLVMPSAAVRTRISAPTDAATERFATARVRSRVTARPVRPVAAPRPGASTIPARRRPNALVVGTIAAASIAIVWGVVAAAVESTPGPTAVAAVTSAPPPEPVQAVTVPTVEKRVVDVPATASLVLDEARLRMTAAGLVVGDIGVVDSTSPANTVLDTSPSAGQRVEVGDTVSITVASGSNVVPTVSGMSADAAVAAMQAAGFFVSTATVEDRVAVTGSVVGSQPSAGSSTPLGSTVTVLVAFSTPHETAAPTRPPVPTTTATPPPPTPVATDQPPAP